MQYFISHSALLGLPASHSIQVTGFVHGFIFLNNHSNNTPTVSGGRKTILNINQPEWSESMLKEGIQSPSDFQSHAEKVLRPATENMAKVKNDSVKSPQLYQILLLYYFGLVNKSESHAFLICFLGLC